MDEDNSDYEADMPQSDEKDKSTEKDNQTTEKAVEVPDELKKKKKARTVRPFTEDDLISQAGLKFVYKNFPSVCISGESSGHEARDLNNLINQYKEWAFRLHPGLAFPDFLNRIESFGSKGPVKVALGSLRNRERKRYLDGVAKLTQRNRRNNVHTNVTSVDKTHHEVPTTVRAMPESSDEEQTSRQMPESEEQDDQLLSRHFNSNIDDTELEQEYVSQF